MQNDALSLWLPNTKQYQIQFELLDPFLPLLHRVATTHVAYVTQ